MAYGFNVFLIRSTRSFCRSNKAKFGMYRALYLAVDLSELFDRKFILSFMCANCFLRYNNKKPIPLESK